MVRDIIIASSSDKVRAQLRGFVAEMGIMGVIECRSASQTLDFTQRLPSAIIICHRLTDMAPAAMLRLLPPGADMILLISSAQSPLFGMSNVQCMTLPLSRPEFRSAIEKLLRSSSESRIRSGGQRNTADQEIIDKAKHLYMKVNGVSEEDAYAYIRRRSMNESSSINATARHLLSELANI